MIYNSTYSDLEKEIETNSLVGKKYNLLKSIRLGGIGSKRLIVDELGSKLKDLIKQKSDIIYSNIELRNKGIIVYIVDRQKRYTWVIPFYKLVIYKTPSFSIHSEGTFIRYSNKLNHKENLVFFKKLLEHKFNYNKHSNQI
tara:strand:- start:14193 stop:14615 length:423 start_codon:yes stop_codon:yes gene_type:complete